MNPHEHGTESRSIDVEGPLLSPTRSYIKRGYGASCGCLIMLLLGSALAVRVAWGPAKKTLETVPPTITSSILLYPANGVITITRRDSANVNHVIEAFKALPVGTYSGLLQAKNVYTSGNHSTKALWQSFTTELKEYFIRPGGKEARDEYTIAWIEVQTALTEIKNAYLKNCRVQKLDCVIDRDSQTDLEITMKDSTKNLEAHVTVENFNLAREGVESLKLTVTIPDQP